LGEIVRALEIEHGVAVMDPWGVIEGTETGMAIPGGQTPEAAFRALLGEHELLFYYPALGAAGAGRLAEVWVYPQGMIDRRAMGGLSGEGAADLAGDGASRRAALIENAVTRDPGTAQDYVLRGLGDVSEMVRARTVAVATGMGVPIPRETLLELMRSDPTESVRVAALDALAAAASDPESLRELVRQAELDPSPAVRAKAAELAAMYESPIEMPDSEPMPDVIEVPFEPGTGAPLQPADGAFSAPLR
jgi:hypothetical protein